MRMKRFQTSLLSLVLTVSVFGAVLYNRQSIYDWVRLRNYNPSANIASLATATTMNDKTRRVFYVNQPQLQTKTDFNQNCTDSEQSIVLGCYIQNRGIYLYDIQDPRLNGVEEVTAAHEMLHAAYDRLSKEDRAHVDVLTEQAYKSLSNERIKKTIEAYRAKDASVVPNELHSILGTEVRDLSPELETYYRRYFTNRETIVAFSEKYEAEFSRLENQAKQYKTELDVLHIKIETTTSELEARAARLAKDYKQLESTRNTSNPDRFNVQVRTYNQEVAKYNQDVKGVSGMIDQYNALVEKYNSVVLEETGLVKAIDSRPEAIQAQ